MTTAGRATFQGVVVPYDLEKFCTPRWPDVLKLYRVWAAEVRTAGKEPWAIQAYLLEFAKCLSAAGYTERLGDRVYSSADEILERAFAHYGVVTFSQIMNECR